MTRNAIRFTPAELVPLALGALMAIAAPALAAPSKVDKESFTVEIKTAGTYKAGAAGQVEVLLTPKSGYHTNAQYPYKFKLIDPAPADVTYGKPMLVRADGTFDEKRGRFMVAFTSTAAGVKTIGGTFHVSVCSEASCVIDKVELAVDVDVK